MKIGRPVIGQFSTGSTSLLQGLCILKLRHYVRYTILIILIRKKKTNRGKKRSFSKEQYHGDFDTFVVITELKL